MDAGPGGRLMAFGGSRHRRAFFGRLLCAQRRQASGTGVRRGTIL
jgi:hypothetical protein